MPRPRRQRNVPSTSRPVGPGAHHFLRSPVAEKQVDGVDDDRLAGARLAGEHVEARAESQFQLVDDRQVADAEFC